MRIVMFFFFYFFYFCFWRFDPAFCPPFSLSFSPFSFAFSYGPFEPRLIGVDGTALQRYNGKPNIFGSKI